MSARSDSHRRILFATSAVGGASVVGILFGLIRMKVAALILGTVGIGVIGLLQSLIATASSLAGLGIGAAATRQIAWRRASEGGAGEALARKALATATLVMALIGALIVWVARAAISERLFGSQAYATEVGWSGIAVGLTMLGVGQSALLTGMRRTRDLALSVIFAAVFTTATSVAALLLLPASIALIAFVIAAPAATALVGLYFVARVPRSAGDPAAAGPLIGEWRKLVALGVPIMLAGLAATAGPLIVRGLIGDDLGAHGLGLFQASWAISTTYLGVVLQAMAADYYPRLSEAIEDRAAARALVNEQTEVAILIAGPLILLLIATAPWIIELLFSSEFMPAANMLRWQILGDVLKIASWPMGFVLLASARGREYALYELAAFGAFIAVTWALLPLTGLSAPGMAFLAMYGIYLPLVFLAARRTIGFRWNKTVLYDVLTLAIIAAALVALSFFMPPLALPAGLLCCAVMGIKAVRRLDLQRLIRRSASAG